MYKINYMTKENWTNIHEDFGRKIRLNINETYQQLWEKEDLTYQDAQEWIKIGFTPRDCRGIKSWKNHNFTPQQTKSWIEADLTIQEYKFTSYLRQNITLFKFLARFKVIIQAMFKIFSHIFFL